MIRFFLSVNLNSVNNRNETALHYSLSGEADEKVIRILLEHGANASAVTSKLETPLSICLKKRLPMEIFQLLEVKGFPDMDKFEIFNSLFVEIWRARLLFLEI